MKTLLVAVISVVLVATSAHARIGESVKQVEARYGKPQKIFIDRPDLRKVGYGYRGFMVMVYFSGGVSRPISAVASSLEIFQRQIDPRNLVPPFGVTTQNIASFSAMPFMILVMKLCASSSVFAFGRSRYLLISSLDRKARISCSSSGLRFRNA